LLGELLTDHPAERLIAHDAALDGHEYAARAAWRRESRLEVGAGEPAVLTIQRRSRTGGTARRCRTLSATEPEG
jgi:hypothetical protein